MPGPLSNLMVLDLTRVLAGPWCTQTLADLGADVIKVERPAVGDDTRHWGPPWIPDGSGRPTRDSAYFSSANRNKKSIAVDISTPEGRALIRELASTADILVENYKVGNLSRYGLGYEDMRNLNPGLIYCSVTGYGQGGPYANLPAYDFIVQGAGGLMSINGEADNKPGGGPMKVSIAVTDVLSGLNATIGILAAVHSRHLTGQGQHIDIALLDVIVNFGANQLASYFITGEVPERYGNEHPNLTPYQTFPTADGHIIIGCGNDDQYRRLCTVLGHPELASDDRFLTMADRNTNRTALQVVLQDLLGTKTTADWVDVLVNAGIPCGPINNYRQVFEHPQVVHRQMRVDMHHPAGGMIGTVRSPIRFSDTPVEYRMGPPLRGQHTEEILSSVLGKAPRTIDALRDAGIVETCTPG